MNSKLFMRNVMIRCLSICFLSFMLQIVVDRRSHNREILEKSEVKDCPGSLVLSKLLSITIPMGRVCTRYSIGNWKLINLFFSESAIPSWVKIKESWNISRNGSVWTLLPPWLILWKSPPLCLSAKQLWHCFRRYCTIKAVKMRKRRMISVKAFA